MKNKYTFTHEHDEFECMLSTDSVQCDMIIDFFIYFLLACSFHRDTIFTALRSKLEQEEYEEGDNE